MRVPVGVLSVPAPRVLVRIYICVPILLPPFIVFPCNPHISIYILLSFGKVPFLFLEEYLLM
jgi:hypothetical protein